MSKRLKRRELLQVGGLGFAGLTLPDLLRAQTSASHPQADACILIFLNGGASHLDMWDMKPDAPEAIRGEFKPVDSTVPGIQICEHLPRLARQIHRMTLVRSMQHSVNNAHAAAVYTSITGHDRGDATVAIGESSRDYPTLGAMLQSLRPGPRHLAPHVVLPYVTKEGAGGPPQPGFYGGFFGRAYDPLFVLNDPNNPQFNIPEMTLTGDVPRERLAARRALLDRVGTGLTGHKGQPVVDSLDQFQQQAFDLLSSSQAREAINLAAESDPTRERYGRNIYGQSVLLARRLIEAGTRVVTISWAPDANATWDTHQGNFTKLKNTLLPQFDAACSSLVEDLVTRGLYERTIVAVLGDFGRTPQVNRNGGRDHWNRCYTVMLGGGGFKGGFVYGASDSIGGLPSRDPLKPGDIIASIYRQLGINPTQMVYDQFGRPHRLVATGDPISALLLS
jgi:uncharacterized protein (DUF1501 family)